MVLAPLSALGGPGMAKNGNKGDCRAPMSWDSKGQCKCPQHMEMKLGQCNPCTGALINGVCNTCAPGQGVLGSGVCGVCPAGQGVVDSGRCSACASDQGVLANGHCGVCPSGEGLQSNGRCGACPSGQVSLSNGQCGYNKNCGPGRHFDEGRLACADGCPAGMHWGYVQTMAAGTSQSGAASCVKDTVIPAKCPPGQYQTQGGVYGSTRELYCANIPDPDPAWTRTVGDTWCRTFWVEGWHGTMTKYLLGDGSKLCAKNTKGVYELNCNRTGGVSVQRQYCN